MSERERVFNDPTGTAAPKDLYLYAIVGGISSFAGAVTTAWRAFNFDLELWQWATLAIVPFIGAWIMVEIMTRKVRGAP